MQDKKMHLNHENHENSRKKANTVLPQMPTEFTPVHQFHSYSTVSPVTIEKRKATRAGDCSLSKLVARRLSIFVTYFHSFLQNFIDRVLTSDCL
jgi:hypothetical protein